MTMCQEFGNLRGGKDKKFVGSGRAVEWLFESVGDLHWAGLEGAWLMSALRREPMSRGCSGAEGKAGVAPS